MMMRKENFDQLFPEALQLAADISHAGEPSAECLARWEDDGGRAAPPHLERHPKPAMRDGLDGFGLSWSHLGR